MNIDRRFIPRLAGRARPFATWAPPRPRALLVVLVEMAFDDGRLLDAARFDDDHAIVAYDPTQMDAPQVLLRLSQLIGRPVLDIEDDGEALV